MIVKCPKCHAEMEGELLVGDLVECPGCHTPFTLKRDDVVANRHARSKRHRLAIVSVCVVLLFTVISLLALNVKSNRMNGREKSNSNGENATSAPPVPTAARSQPETKMNGREKSNSNGGDATSAHSAPTATQSQLKTKPRSLTEAEQVFLNGLNYMFGDNGYAKDIAKAYAEFDKAKSLGYEFANVALEHLQWATREKEDRAALEALGVSLYPLGMMTVQYGNYRLLGDNPLFADLPSWVAHFGLAKFELGLSMMTWPSQRDNEEGLGLIVEAAKEDVGVAISFIKSFFSATYGLSVSEVIPIVKAQLNPNGDVFIHFQEQCGLELNLKRAVVRCAI